MLELLIILFCILGWMCCMSLCVKQKEVKSEGRMPGSYVIESQKKISEPISPAPNASTNSTEKSNEKSTDKSFDEQPIRKKAGLRDRRRKFSKEEDRRPGTPERHSDENMEQAKDEKKEDKNDEKKEDKNEEKKEEKNDRKNEENKEKKELEVKKNEEKDKKTVDRTEATLKEKPEAMGSDLKVLSSKRSNKTLKEDKTQIMEVQSLSKPYSLRDASTKDSAIPGETLALLAAAEQMALDKGDYDNFGPPGALKAKREDESSEKPCASGF